MKYAVLVGLMLSSSLTFGAPPKSEETEAAYAAALEYVYEKRFDEAKTILEQIYADSGSQQVAETLVDVYFFCLEDLGEKGNLPEIELRYPEIRSNIEALFAKHPEKALFQSAIKSAFFLNDLEFAGRLARAYLERVPDDPTATGILAFALARKSDNPDEVIAAYAGIARMEPATPEEVGMVNQARVEMARAYQMKGQERLSLKYMRLVDPIQKSGDLRLASMEFLFLNFPYAVKQLERFDPAFFSSDQWTFYIGALFAEGSKESLKKMDAILSAKESLSPYEEALSLHRRGINSRALAVLDTVDDPIVRKFYPHLYLDLRHKILTRLQDTEQLIPVRETIGGQAYLLGKFPMALSYLTNLKDNDKGELSYLLGSVYHKEKRYAEARKYLLAHLKSSEARYEKQALSDLVDIAIAEKDYDAAENYLTLYEKDAGETALPRGTIALKRGDFPRAKAIFAPYFEQLYGDNTRKATGYHIASVYLSQWLDTRQSEDALLAEARKYIDASYEIVNKTKESLDGMDLGIYNLYAYCYALDAKAPLPQEAMDAAAYAVSRSPNAAFLDTAAVTFFRASKTANPSECAGYDPTLAKSYVSAAEYYFSTLEKEMALMDAEEEYSKTLAPPFFDETAKKDPQYYEIYMHLAAWHRYMGKDELAQKAEKEMLRLAEDKELARIQLDNLYNTWKK